MLAADRPGRLWRRIRATALRPLLLVLAATLALLVVLLSFPGREALAVYVYLLAIAALLLCTLARSVAQVGPVTSGSVLDLAPRGKGVPEGRLPELETLTRLIMFASWSTTDVHYRLRPILREVAAHRLAAHRAIDLAEQPGAARAVVGEAAWELLRPDRPDPADRHGSGMEISALAAVIDALEKI
jgi:hypothetical protein